MSKTSEDSDRPERTNHRAGATQSVDVSELPTMRAVHFFTPPDWVKAHLYAGVDYPDAEALFGVHWNASPVWSRGSFEERGQKSDYNAMERAANGALVAAYYGARSDELDQEDEFDLNNHIKIGVCPPGSSVQAIPFTHSSQKSDFVHVLPLVDTVEVSREAAEGLFVDNVAGHAVYESGDKEANIRDAYSQRRD